MDDSQESNEEKPFHGRLCLFNTYENDGEHPKDDEFARSAT
jgi:hypothetical protein